VRLGTIWLRALTATSGSLRKLFEEVAVGQFGSSWAWLVTDKRDLKIVKTANAMTPIVYGHVPLRSTMN
jgi:superoxide dismutase, Fe-Mn family